MEKRIIKVNVRSIYGNETIYPSCEIAKGFAELLRQKTLTWLDIQVIKQIGYEVVVDQQPKTL